MIVLMATRWVAISTYKRTIMFDYPMLLWCIAIYTFLCITQKIISYYDRKRNKFH